MRVDGFMPDELAVSYQQCSYRKAHWDDPVDGIALLRLCRRWYSMCYVRCRALSARAAAWLVKAMSAANWQAYQAQVVVLMGSRPALQATARRELDSSRERLLSAADPRAGADSEQKYWEKRFAELLEFFPWHASELDAMAGQALRSGEPPSADAAYAADVAGTDSDARETPQTASNDGNADRLRGEDAYDRGNAACRAGDLAEAERLLRIALAAGYRLAATNLGTVLARRGQAAEAEQLWLRAAEAGDDNAAANLALQAEARGDLMMADRWWVRAAILGHQDAEYRVGLQRYRRGELADADRWLTVAMSHGHRDAAWALGVLRFEQGRSAEAAEAWRQAGLMGHVQAAKNLAAMVSDQPESEEEKERWLRQAAEYDDAEAAASLYQLCLDRGDDDAAEYWIRKAASGGYAPAVEIVARLDREQEIIDAISTGDVNAAEARWRVRAMEGDAEAAFQLGCFYQKLGDLDQAEQLWLIAARADDPMACYNLAELYDRRDGDATTGGWLHRAAAAGYAPAQAKLGQHFLVILGQPEQAESWLARAAKAGSVAAHCSYGTLLSGRAEQADAEELWAHAARNGDSWAARKLADLCEQRGDPAAAVNWAAIADRGGETPADKLADPSPAAVRRAARLGY
jgi:hypothetical protein